MKYGFLFKIKKLNQFKSKRIDYFHAEIPLKKLGYLSNIKIFAGHAAIKWYLTD